MGSIDGVENTTRRLVGVKGDDITELLKERDFVILFRYCSRVDDMMLE